MPVWRRVGQCRTARRGTQIAVARIDTDALRG
jgi:hypothetical protein